MRRRVVVILIFLLAGAVVNVGVAWGIVWKADWDSAINRRQLQEGEEWRWPCDVPPHWPNTANWYWRTQWFGVTELSHLNGRYTGPTPDLPPDLVFFNWSKHPYVEALDADFVNYRIDSHRAGWPMLGLEWDDWSESLVHSEKSRSDQPTGRLKITNRTEDLPAQSKWWVRGIPLKPSTASAGAGRQNRYPIRPSWPGFAVNTIFYAAILWLLIPGPFALRRLIRRRRGRCPACGYDLKHAEHETCPECGAAKKRRPARAT